MLMQRDEAHSHLCHASTFACGSVFRSHSCTAFDCDKCCEHICERTPPPAPPTSPPTPSSPATLSPSPPQTPLSFCYWRCYSTAANERRAVTTFADRSIARPNQLYPTAQAGSCTDIDGMYYCVLHDSAITLRAAAWLLHVDAYNKCAPDILCPLLSSAASSLTRLSPVQFCPYLAPGGPPNCDICQD